MLIGRPKRDPAMLRQIKQWAFEHLPVTRSATVSVMELECHEPGCPPLETVVAVMELGKETRHWKFHKAVPDISVADFTELQT